MHFRPGATVTVADGKKLHLFRIAHDVHLKKALDPVDFKNTEARSDLGNQCKAGNFDDKQVEEDTVSTGITSISAVSAGGSD